MDIWEIIEVVGLITALAAAFYNSRRDEADREAVRAMRKEFDEFRVDYVIMEYRFENELVTGLADAHEKIYKLENPARKRAARK